MSRHSIDPTFMALLKLMQIDDCIVYPVVKDYCRRYQKVLQNQSHQGEGSYRSIYDNGKLFVVRIK